MNPVIALSIIGAVTYFAAKAKASSGSQSAIGLAFNDLPRRRLGIDPNPKIQHPPVNTGPQIAVPGPLKIGASPAGSASSGASGGSGGIGGGGIGGGIGSPSGGFRVSIL